MKLLKYLPLLSVGLILVACSFSVNIPSIDTSTTHELVISQPIPENASEPSLALEMGGGKLNITGGSSKMVEGTVLYNVDDWKPTISATDDSVLISQDHSTNVGIPTGNIKNDWSLKLGSVPMSLRISAGAYAGTLNLSGLSLTNLEISDGASQATVRFDSLNPVTMQRFVYKTGASSVNLVGLGNANASQIDFESGAGNYTLDFTGAQSKGINAKISSGLSQVKVIVPKNAHAIVNLEGGLSNVDAEGTWMMQDSKFEAGDSGPIITINVQMAVGNLVLQQK